jgi:VPDSG-CTERM motif
MKTFKYSILIAVLCAGLASFAQATLSGPTTVSNDTLGNQDPATIQLYFQTHFGHPDASDCLRAESSDDVFNGGTFDLAGGGTVTITPGDTGHANVAFDLTGSGQVICGFFIFGGASGNFYTVSADEGLTGNFDIVTPVNKGGQIPGISHIDIFCCPGGTTAPDSGSAAMLLGSALTGLGLVRRYLKR